MRNLLPDLKPLSLIKKIVLGLFVLLILFILLLTSLVATQAGSRWVALQAAHIANIRLGNIQGNLLTGLDVASIDSNNYELQIHAEKISFRWQPLALFYTSVSVQSLTVEKMSVRLPASKNEPNNKTLPEQFEWPSLALPVRIELGSLKLNDIQILQNDDTFKIDSIAGSFSLGTFNLRINDLAVGNSQAHITTKGTMGLRYPYDLNIKSQWQYKLSTLEPAAGGELNIAGNIEKINAQHNLLSPLTLKTIATIEPALHGNHKTPYADITNDWPQQDIPHTLIKNHANLPFLSTLLSTHGHLQLQGWLDSHTIQGTLNANTKDAILSADINAKGTRKTNAQQQTLSMSWQLNNLQLATHTLITTDKTPEENRLQLTGNIHWGSAISSDPAINWNLLLQGEHFNAGQYFLNVPSDLHIHIATHGELKHQQNYTAKNLRIAISELSIAGELRGLNLTAQGAMNFDGNYWQSSDINVALGANQLSLKGKAGNDLAIEWQLNAPLLNQIDPSLNGNIISAGMINSSFTENANSTKAIATKPKINIHMDTSINQFSWRNYSIDKLTLKLNPKAGSQYALSLDAEHLQLQGQRIAHISAKGDGSIAEHSIAGKIQSPLYGELEFDVSGGWKNNLWQGQWQKLTIALKKIPLWYLSSSSPMQADKSHAELSKLCLTSATKVTAKTQFLVNNNNLPRSKVSTNIENSLTGESTQKSDLATQEAPSMCLSGKWNTTNGLSASINALAVPIQQLRAWVKPEVTLDGVVDAQMSLLASRTTAPNAELHLQTRDVQFTYQFQGGNTEVYPLKSSTLDLTLKNNHINSTVFMDWGKYGVINAGNKYTLLDKKIQGKISATLPDLAPLESLLPSLDDVHGSASAAITIQGTIEKPEITGNFRLQDGSANMPKLGLTLKEIALTLTSQNADLIHIEGQVLSGEGRLMLKGDAANMGAKNWQCHGNIFGAGIRIIQQPELSATISPNLTFTADSTAIHLNGSTEIPWARVAVKTLPESATRVSNDVTILESNHASKSQNAPKHSIPFYTNVILYFGDDVRFKGFGLDGQLSGKINVLKTENRQTLTTGFVAVNKGIYKAYGQELSIARGRLIFQGPYDNPGLDIRALRTIETVTSGETTSAGQSIVAGLEISGTLQHPKSTVFAIPSLDDSKAMALLVTGKALNQLSTGDAYSIIAAVSSMGVENGSTITSDIARFFRLDEITIKADKGLDQSVLWVGKYLTPKLFVRYVVGLFDQAFTLGMRYQITEKIQLEAESGKTQSVDIIYKIER